MSTYSYKVSQWWAINNKEFKRLGYVNGQLFKVELAKSEIEQKDPINVDFFSYKMQNLEC